MLIGNLGSDPELRNTNSGASVANFSVATTERYKDKEGNVKETTEWHRIVVWGKQAEVCDKFLSKGKKVYVEGRIQTREWEDGDGNKRHSTEINAQKIEFLSPKGDAPQKNEGKNQSFNDEDIPF